MPQWAGSSWYFLRYMDPHNDKELVGKEAEEYWGPVDWYNGGMEHTICTCSTPASGISSSMTSAWFTPRSPMPSAPATA